VSRLTQSIVPTRRSNVSTSVLRRKNARGEERDDL